MHPSSRPPRLRRLLLAALLACGTPAFAQDAVVAVDARTGDAWIDARIDDISAYGRAYRDPFVDELVRYHRAPRELVLELLTRRGWSPGDVYFACALAAQAGRPCRAVAEDYERDREAGWGALAQRLGVAPGSPQFHALKKGFVPTYDRWARPLRIDADLARDFPGRRVEAPAVRDGAKGGDAASPGQARGPEAKGPSPKPGKSGRGDDGEKEKGGKPGKKAGGG